MVDQKEEAKMGKFIETMPTMIQTHLIICENWVDITDKATGAQYWECIHISHTRLTKKKYPHHLKGQN